MLSDKARSAVSYMLGLGCFLKIYPYRWDAEKYQFMPAGTNHIRWFLLHASVVLWAWAFMAARFMQTINDEVPTRLRVMNIIWVLAFALGCACNFQFVQRRGEVMFVANAMFQAQELKRKESLAKKKGIQIRKLDWISLIVLMGAVLAFINPPVHALVLLFGPCAPQYMSSIILTCDSFLYIPESIFTALPFVLYEIYIVGDVIFVWSFNWCFIFYGFVWIQETLYKTRTSVEGEQQSEPVVYRYCQVILILINDAFKFYLEWFPSILFTIAGMLLFSAIRYTELHLLLYLVFPACGSRCLYEAITALAVAGSMNQESIDFRTCWKNKIHRILGMEQKYESAFHKSCPSLQCNAGSLYTFENSIVLVSLHNCTQLTFNMLVTYK